MSTDVSQLPSKYVAYLRFENGSAHFFICFREAIERRLYDKIVYVVSERTPTGEIQMDI